MAAPLRPGNDGRSTPPSGIPTPAARRPSLSVAPKPQRRWPVALASIALLVVMAGLLGAAVFHTQLAERQIRIDQLERSVNDQRERFDELRYQRAELRSPVRLAEAAGGLGMVPGDTGVFVQLDPMQVAQQLAAAGVIDQTTSELVIDTDPLEQFSDVKRVSAGQP